MVAPLLSRGGDDLHTRDPDLMLHISPPYNLARDMPYEPK